MTRTNLITKLKASLHDAARVLNAALDADYERIVDSALLAMSLPDGRPLVKQAELALVAGVNEYAAPADMVGVRSACDWGKDSRQDYKPWEDGYLQRLLELRAYSDGETRMLLTNYAPTAGMIAQHGAAAKYRYYALHTLTDEATTVPDTDELILLTRCQAEAMNELMMRNYTEPVAVMGGQDDINGSAQQVYQVLIGRYYGMCRA